MHEGGLVHRVVSAQQAEVLRGAIANHRTAKKLMKKWESETERLMDANMIAIIRLAPRSAPNCGQMRQSTCGEQVSVPTCADFG